MGEGVPLSSALPPVPPVCKVVGKTFRYIWLQSPSWRDPDQFFFFCLSYFACLPCEPGTWFSSTS
jgi:hypothetical protein